MCITSAADEVNGKVTQEKKKAWFVEECQEATRKMRCTDKSSRGEQEPKM
jgi:hypothetical protein